MKRILALMLVALSLITLVSCNGTRGAEDSGYIMTVGETRIPSAAFYSEIYGYKNDFLFNFLGLTEDNAEIWKQDSPSGENETVGDTLKRMALEDMVQFAWVAEYARLSGAQLTEEDNAQIEEAIQTAKDNFETEEEYKEYLSMLTFTEETFREYLAYTFMYDKGFALLVGENGLYPIAEEEYDRYYEENFYTVKHIFINNVSKMDDEGNVSALTDDEKKAQEDKAEQIYNDIGNGTAFETLYMLSEDDMSNLYPDGLTFTEGMIDTAYEAAVKTLDIGAYTKVNGANGGIYIIKRIELSEADREEYDGYVSSAVESVVQDRIYSDHSAEVEVNYELVNSYKMEDIPVQNMSDAMLSYADDSESEEN